jgi:hypothetical protein
MTTLYNLSNNYKVLEEGTPLTIKLGRYSGETRNMYWKVKDTITKNTFYLIHIVDDTFTKISVDDINKVLNFKDIRPCWRLFVNGYVCCSTYNDEKKEKVYYLHQLIMDVHDKDLTSMKETVDHINNDKLDNRKENLRLVDMSIQNSNRPKAQRRKDACDLPEGIKQTDLPKYVTYRKEILDKETDKYRECFVIDNHPKLSKPWETTKSNKIDISKKLEIAKLKLQVLEDKINPDVLNKELGLDKKIDLPVGIRLVERNTKLQFSYDYKDTKNDLRYTCKMVLKSDDIQIELDNFIDIINNKYDFLKINKYKIKNIIVNDNIPEKQQNLI